MYRKHFGLQEKPFAITPDPRFLYMSPRHREALAHLLYGVGEGGGFVQLTGEVGTGKTTVCRGLLEQLPDGLEVALILNPKLTATELVASICDELRIARPAGEASLKAMVDLLNRHLLRVHGEGRHTVLVIDEAQNLSAEVLEQVRLLTNLETNQAKLLQIILIGQPELKDLLARNDLRQLAQRITARYHLEPLGRAETRDYIAHRLRICGVTGDLFTPLALRRIHRLSGGVPRLINILCDRALLGAYVEDQRRVGLRILRRAAREVLPAPVPAAPARRRWAAWAAVVLLGAGLAVAINGLRESRQPEIIAAAAPSGGEAPLAVAQAAETPSTDPLHGLLTDAGDATAWHDLFALWRLQYDPGTSPCQQAQADGLRCLEDRGTLTRLRNIDRPAILELVAADGHRVPVVLAGLQGGDARLLQGGDTHLLPLAAVERHWYGDYTLLWRPAVGAVLLKPGDRGPGVLWLRARLDAVLGAVPAPADPAYFDDALRQRVMAFQRSRALRQDGVVGEQTLIQLNSTAAGPDTPRLLSPTA